VTGIEFELANLSLRYLNATTEELASINASLDSMDIPTEIEITKSALSILAFPQTENIDLNVLEIVTESSSGEGDYKNALLGWNFNNLDTKISFKEFSVNYEDSREVILKTFDLESTKKDIIDYPVYIFMKKLDNILLKENYAEGEQGDYYYFNFTDNAETISFSTTENVNFTNLPFFISPALTELELTDFNYTKGVDKKDIDEKRKWTIFTLVIILLLIFGIILYLVLQTWYKRRYEEYLFRNRNDLYNLAVYITNSKKRGLDNIQIKEKLRNSKWNAEQIRYALRKYSGRRTGMYEIPLKKALEKKGERGKGFQGYGTR
jgi:hypothetical protein